MENEHPVSDTFFDNVLDEAFDTPPEGRGQVLAPLSEGQRKEVEVLLRTADMVRSAPPLVEVEPATKERTGRTLQAAVEKKRGSLGF